MSTIQLLQIFGTFSEEFKRPNKIHAHFARFLAFQFATTNQLNLTLSSAVRRASALPWPSIWICHYRQKSPQLLALFDNCSWVSCIKQVQEKLSYFDTGGMNSSTFELLTHETRLPLDASPLKPNPCLVQTVNLQRFTSSWQIVQMGK